MVREIVLSNTSALVLVFLFVCCTSACTAQKRADVALSEGRYADALMLYEQEIDDGSKDPEVFTSAARAANKVGDFATAERHYSRALRYGAGVPVMREFADFYISTGNYVSAARVLSALIDIDDDKPTIYNNLGTALLYGGRPVEAESYLLTSQQLRPESPLPYLNLGVIYERHYKRYALGMSFYLCYLELSGQQGVQLTQIQSRLTELGRFVDGSPPDIGCGEPYFAPDAAELDADAKRAALRALKDRARAEDAGVQPEAPKGAVVDDKGPGDSSNAVTRDGTYEEARKLARRHYRAGKCADVFLTYDDVPVEARVVDDFRVLASCYSMSGQALEALEANLTVLEMDPNSVDLAIVLRALGTSRPAETRSLCEKYELQITTVELEALCEAATRPPSP